ncbi:GCG_CRPN prefix-to-repeats domain-containing protein [Mesorhizobium sp. AR02]|uniref:GCG_CRPN prefix-to-repeats domain-containing protein n=1 Tax=Mesorhizobium sp. AR02 TaxID=2865837 RepID=UPI003A5BE324
MGSGPSSAFPLGVPNPHVASAPAENVRYGCGRGWHPNRWGRCVPNRRVVVRPVVRGPVIIYRPGWHYRHWHYWH